MASIFRFDAAGAHYAPAAPGFEQTKSTAWNQCQTKPTARDAHEDSGNDQQDPENAADDASSPVNVWHKEFLHKLVSRF